MPETSPLAHHLRSVRDRIAQAEARAGRPPGSARLLPVTKSVGPEVCAELLALGEADLAENRADVLEAKAAWMRDHGLRPRWHFIGHLQRNKARRVVRLADVVHSVDSLRLLEALERLAAEERRELEVYLQVNVAREERKHGLDPGPPGLAPQQAVRSGELGEALARCASLAHLRPVGLMGMGPLEPGRDAREAFEELAALARAVADCELGAPFPEGRPRLSMGMSGDLEEAVAAGSDLVRVGGALFTDLPGRRPT